MLEKIEELTKKACLNNGVALYDVELKNTQKGKLLLVSVNKVGGVTVEDCRNVSKTLGSFLDEEEHNGEELINGNYMLEVSSPGVDRNLRLKRHYASAINERVKITFIHEDQKISETGLLKEVLPDLVTIVLDNEDEVDIPFSSIKKAKTCFDFESKKKK